MKLEKIISVSGKPGLYKLVNQSKGGFIVEDLQSKKKTSITAQNQVSLLENIAIYTEDEELPLGDVFAKMAEVNNFQPTISAKSSEKELREKMEEFLPEYDEDRVYVSDIKKLFSWYNLLLESDVINPESVKEDTEKGEE